MKNVLLFCRVGLGLIFVVLPLLARLSENAFSNFPLKANNFLMTLEQTGYLMNTILTLELTAGILLLINIFVPFALVLLAPIIYNIFMFHLILNSGTLLSQKMILPGVIVVLFVILLLANYRNFLPLFKKSA